MVYSERLVLKEIMTVGADDTVIRGTQRHSKSSRVLSFVMPCDLDLLNI